MAEYARLLLYRGGGGVGDWDSVNSDNSDATTEFIINLPNGFTLLESRNFETLAGEGWWYSNNGKIDIVANGSANVNGEFTQSVSGNLGRIIFPANDTQLDGTAPASTGIDPANSAIWHAGSSEVWLEFEHAVSTNWVNHPTGTNKIFFVTASGYGGGGDPCVVCYDSDFNPPRYTIFQQGPGVTIRDLRPNLSTIGAPHGSVNHVKIHIVANTPGNSDGQAHMWVNGVKTTEHTNVQFMNAGYLFDHVVAQPTYGGVGAGVLASPQYMYFSRIGVAVKGGGV